MMEGGNMSPFVKAWEDLQSAAPPCVWRNPEENGRLQGTNLHSRAQPRQCLNPRYALHYHRGKLRVSAEFSRNRGYLILDIHSHQDAMNWVPHSLPKS
jgi:hypothetical protein